MHTISICICVWSDWANSMYGNPRRIILHIGQHPLIRQMKLIIAIISQPSMKDVLTRKLTHGSEGIIWTIECIIHHPFIQKPLHLQPIQARKSSLLIYVSSFHEAEFEKLNGSKKLNQVHRDLLNLLQSQSWDHIQVAILTEWKGTENGSSNETNERGEQRSMTVGLMSDSFTSHLLSSSSHGNTDLDSFDVCLECCVDNLLSWSCCKNHH